MPNEGIRRKAPAFTPRHERFCLAIAGGNTPADAYAVAGFHASHGGAVRCASRLLTRVDVARRIREIQQLAADRAGVTVDRVLQELMWIGFADIREVVDWEGQSVVEEDS